MSGSYVCFTTSVNPFPEKILAELDEPGESSGHDSSTAGLINIFKKRSAL